MEPEILSPGETTPAPLPAIPTKLGFWCNLMAILWIVNGALSSVTIIGAPFGIPTIIAGAKLLKVASLSKELTVTDPKTAELLDNLNSFFKINGLIFFIAIGFLVLLVLVLICLGLIGLFFNEELFARG